MASITDGPQSCCGVPVDVDGYCQHRSHHPRQITPELRRRALATFETVTRSGFGSTDGVEAVIRVVLYRDQS